MTKTRPFRQVIEKLRDAGLRPTKQRMALAKLLFEGPDRHVTAEILHVEAISHGISVSLATIYNTLNQFTAVHMLREIVVDGERSYFDTNNSNHHHFFHTDTQQLEDIGADDIVMASLPEAPLGTKISRIDVVVRLEKS